MSLNQINRFIRVVLCGASLVVVRFTRVAPVVLALIFPALVTRAQTPPAVAQYIGVRQPIKSQFGSPLRGTESFSFEFGITPVAGDLVHILKTTDGNIHPPQANGQPDPRNEVIMTTRIGAGMSPALARSGKFSSQLTPRPAGNTRIFVRVFNAPTIAEATFYGESEIFTISSSENTRFIAEIAATDKPLDPGDNDGDGLNNSWERSLGTSTGSADSDGDGMTDYQEWLAGTDPLNEDSVRPEIVSIRPVGAGQIEISWRPAVKDRTYRIYHTESSPDQLSEADAIATVLTTGTENAVVINQDALSANGAFWFEISR